ACDLGGETDTARALDAAVHGALDQGAKILVFDGALVLLKARGVDAISHGLILQVAFAALVTDRTIQWVIDKQEFHYPFAGLTDHGRPGIHDRRLALRPRPAIAHGPGTARHWLRRTDEFDEAHAAVASD